MTGNMRGAAPPLFARLHAAIRQGAADMLAAEGDRLSAMIRHRLDDPGTRPVSRSGALAASIGFQLKDATLRIGAGGANAPYAPLLELGSMRRAPQPFLRPALRLREGELGEALARALRRRLGPGQGRGA